MNDRIMETRLLMLGLAVLMCAIAWCGSLLPVPVRNSLLRTLIGAGFGFSVGGILLAQVFLDRSMMGTRRGMDPFGWVVFLAGSAVSFLLFVSSNRALRKKAAERGFSGIGG